MAEWSGLGERWQKIRVDKAVRTILTAEEFKEQKPLLREFIRDATLAQDGD